MLRFSLHRPTDLDGAVAAFANAGGRAAYIAGGTELLRLMKLGVAEHGVLIDLKRIGELSGIDPESDGTLRIGATATHRQIERSETVSAAVPALAILAGTLTNLRVRNCGTLGGNIAFADPHSDPTTLLMVCDARVELAGSGGRREVPIGEFGTGPQSTARKPDEVLIAIRIPSRPPGQGVGYARVKFFERPAVTMAVRLDVAHGEITSAHVALGALADRRALVTASADALVGADASDSGLDAALPSALVPLGAIDANDDLDGSAEYKRHLASVMFRRAARDALHEAVGRA